MIEKLVELLKGEELFGYKINEIKRETFQLFFVHDKIETVRKGVTADYSVTVYIGHGEFLGDAQFSIYPSSDDEEIKKAIALAKEKALAVNNRPYELVKGGKGEFSSPSFIEGKTLKEVAAEIAEVVFSAKGAEGSALNATEVFVYRNEKRVVNSEGVDKKSVSYSALLETIPTFNLENGSVEIYAQKEFGSLDKAELKNYVADKLKEVEERAYAKKTDLPAKADVMLRGEEICGIMEEYVYQLGYGAVYNRSNAINKGDELQTGEECDRLFVTMKGKEEGCSDSADFDEDGSAFIDRDVIVGGKAVNCFGGNRYAQYLGEENVGNLRIVKLGCGGLEKSALKGKTYLECLQFSGLQVDLYTDYIGGEVRLAVFHDGEKEIPVSGFSISAKLSDVMNTVKLSGKSCKLPGYSGPEFMVLKDFTIL